MGRNNRRATGHAYIPGGGGGGGGLGGFLASVLGTPPMLEGGDVTDQIDPAVDLGTSGTPVMEPLKVSKPNFFSKVNGGGQQYADLNNALKMGQVDNALKQDLLHKQLMGGQELERLRTANDLTQEETRFGHEKTLSQQKHDLGISEADIKDALTRGLGRDTALRDQLVIPNTTSKLTGDTFKQNLENAAYQSPDVQTAHVLDIFAKLAKQGLENNKTQTEIDTAKKVLPTKGFMGVGPDAMVEPETGRAFMFQKPLMESPAPGYEGGIKETNLSPFRKVEGGLDGQFSGGKIPPMIARPNTSAAVQASQPSLIPSLINSSGMSPMQITPGMVDAGKALMSKNWGGPPGVMGTLKDAGSSIGSAIMNKMAPIAVGTMPQFKAAPESIGASDPFNTPDGGAYMMQDQLGGQQLSPVQKMRYKLKLMGVPGF